MNNLKKALARLSRRRENDRCARCKKIRKMWLSANWWHSKRVASKNVAGEGKVCWICRIREVQPDWRPGMPIPECVREKSQAGPNTG